MAHVEGLRRWAAIPLRLIVGYGFIEHGYAKLANGPEKFASILQAIGVPAPHFTAWMTIAWNYSVDLPYSREHSSPSRVSQ